MPRIHRKTLFALLVALLITVLSTSVTFAQSGSWALVSSPNQGTLGNHLYGVSAISASDSWAVGDYNDGPYKHFARTLTEHWNGSKWSIVKSPNPFTGSNDSDILQAVAAISASNVWAVGSYGDDTGLNTKTLIVHWNGSAWSVVPSPNPSLVQNLYGIAVVSASDIWAVGDYTDQQSRGGSLTLHWNGTTWSQVPNPGVSTLQGVTAIASNDVWAVSLSSEFLHWNGTRWSIFFGPQRFNGAIHAVAAVSSSDVWAVGFLQSNYYNYTVTLHWNGSKWSVISSPSPTDEEGFYGVAVLSATSVWAVGFSSGKTLVEKWNGKHWAVVPSSSMGTFATLQAVTTIPAMGDVWAVGQDFQQTNILKTLTEQCNGC